MARSGTPNLVNGMPNTINGTQSNPVSGGDIRLDQIVHFFRQNNCYGTLKTMATELGLGPELVFPEKPSALMYTTAYNELWEWIATSLDTVKPELSAILYPLYIHCYLGLIENGYISEAIKFLKTHAHEHLPENEIEINKISAVRSLSHFETDECVNLWKTNKYMVKISNFSFELLLRFLQEKNFSILISLISSNIQIKPFIGYPQAEGTVEHTTAFVMSENIDNSTQLYLTTNLQRQNSVECEDPASDKAARRRQREEEKEKKKAKKAKMAEEFNEESIKNKVPLPQNIPSEFMAILANDAKNRVELCHSSLPSICFYTLFNTYENMNCSRISADASLIASGHGDSTIRLHDLQPESKWIKAQRESQKDGRNPKYIKSSFLQSSQLVGHSQPVYSVDFSSDGSYLLSASGDGSARLWSMETKTNVVQYRGHLNPIWQAKFSPSNYYFATASSDKTARLWVTSSLSPLRIFAGHLSDVNCVNFHPNNYYLFTGSNDKSVRLWDLETGSCVRLFVGHTAPIYTNKISPDGRLALSAGEDKNIFIWDLSAGERVSILKGHEKTIWSLDVSCEANIIASGSNDNSVRLWDLRMISDVLTGAKLELTPPSQQILLDTGALEAKRINKTILGVYPTKSTPVQNVQFTRRNLLLASGPFLKQGDDE